MVFPRQGFEGYDLHAIRPDRLGEMVQHRLAIPLLEVILSQVDVLLNLGEHCVNQSSELVS